ncbi:class I SAM-dependent methyltransferase [Dietzia kunjamensis]|uniref:class I SAM-dependent methyltransferase n=1 Tax=Dietzia kunjamensis TaxID=322509 RepID=UPI0039BC76E4
MTREAREAYARRAGEYIDHLGAISTVHPADLELVTRWARQVGGPVLDAGCGPGHWTAHLAEAGVDVGGVDGVSEFVDHARAAHPGCRFEQADLEALPLGDASISGVLAWYSLIHHQPEGIGVPLAEFTRVLRLGGQLLLGFFHGDPVERFDHAVAPAYRWSIGKLAERVRMAHFEVIETYTRTGPGHRPHGAIVAHLSTEH